MSAPGGEIKITTDSTVNPLDRKHIHLIPRKHYFYFISRGLNFRFFFFLPEEANLIHRYILYGPPGLKNFKWLACI